MCIFVLLFYFQNEVLESKEQYIIQLAYLFRKIPYTWALCKPFSFHIL